MSSDCQNNHARIVHVLRLQVGVESPTDRVKFKCVSQSFSLNMVTARVIINVCKNCGEHFLESRKFGNNGRDPANLFQRSGVYRASGPRVGNRKCASGSSPPTLRSGDCGMPLSLSWMPHECVGAKPHACVWGGHWVVPGGQRF